MSANKRKRKNKKKKKKRKEMTQFGKTANYIQAECVKAAAV